MAFYTHEISEWKSEFLNLSDQELFEKVILFLLKQGMKSSDDSFGCAYRGNFGRKCAVGYIIPDLMYYRGIEGLSSSQLIKAYGCIIRQNEDEEMTEFRQEFLKFLVERQLLLKLMQEIHDTVDNYTFDYITASALLETAMDIINTYARYDSINIEVDLTFLRDLAVKEKNHDNQ